MALAAAIPGQRRWGAGHPCLFSWDASDDAHPVATGDEVLPDRSSGAVAEKLVDLELDALAPDGSQSAVRASLGAPCKPDAGQFAARSFSALVLADAAALPVVEPGLRRAIVAAEPEGRSAVARLGLLHSSAAARAAEQPDSSALDGSALEVSLQPEPVAVQLGSPEAQVADAALQHSPE
jgi:hypothetical protein